MAFVIVFLWTIIGMLISIEHADVLSGIEPWASLAAMIIFWIGGPFFIVVTILEFFLDAILPGGWNDDDDFKGY